METVVGFWNRYYYYFKEIMVDFFFFPTFVSWFRKRPVLRLFAAVFMAVAVAFTCLAIHNYRTVAAPSVAAEPSKSAAQPPSEETRPPSTEPPKAPAGEAKPAEGAAPAAPAHSGLAVSDVKKTGAYQTLAKTSGMSAARRRGMGVATALVFIHILSQKKLKFPLYF